MNDGDFEEFVRGSMPALARLAFAMTGDEHDAWDLLQEALIRVGGRWRRATIESPWTYTRTTMARLNTDRIRRSRREITMSEVPAGVVGEITVREVDPLLAAALAGLTANQRTALALKHLEGFGNPEIAGLMGCGEGTVRTHLSRGAAAMKAALAQTEGVQRP